MGNKTTKRPHTCEKQQQIDHTHGKQNNKATSHMGNKTTKRPHTCEKQQSDHTHGKQNKNTSVKGKRKI